MKWSPREWRRLRSGLLFLAPNIVGFMLFTLVPLMLSFALAFTNWDVRRHNIFKTEQLEFIGFQNFERIFSHPAALAATAIIASSCFLIILLSPSRRGKISSRPWAISADSCSSGV